MDERRNNLKENRVIVLVGAGSSALLGLPTLDNLLKRAAFGNDDIGGMIKDTADSIQNKPYLLRKAIFEEVIGNIKRYLEILQTFREDRVLWSAIGQLPSELVNGEALRKWKEALARCYKILYEEYGPAKISPNSKESLLAIRVIKSLCQFNDGELHIYTTNYDCSFQVLALNCKDVSFFTHIENFTNRFSDGWYKTNPAVDTNEKVYIHRLHGCVGWFNYFDARDPNSSIIVEELDGSGFEGNVFLNQMCIKLISSQLTGFNRAFSSAFDEFSSHLRTSTLLFVWGYGFHDLEVVRVINQVFHERKVPLKIVFLDPYVSQEKARSFINVTLMQAPIQPAPNFLLKRIEWTPSPGSVDLAQSITQGIENALKE
jgi:NAD-dependent SIR2 family protein deacetylase